jgi:glycosyltransferase involved in cell wall biosynthesis
VAVVQDNVVIVAQRGEWLGGGPIYGTLRATLEVAKGMVHAGLRVTLVIGSDRINGEIEGVPFRGMCDEEPVTDVLEACQPIDTLIGISRADIFRKADAPRRLVYHHGSHRIQEERVGETANYSALNRAEVQVVCASEHSRAEQIAFGMLPELTCVVHNACNAQVFRPMPGEQRNPHSLLFAGHIVPYKGVDIILRAFEVVRGQFPAATCTFFGSQCSWSECQEHLLPAEWLDRSGMVRWGLVERDVPGVHYEGEATQSRLADAYRRSSLLVMASRVAEPFPLVSLEAQACGCLPVLPRKGGFPETVQDGVTGQLYDELSSGELARTIMGLWAQGLPTAEQRVWAQSWVVDTFSWEKSATEFQQIVESMPSSTRTKRRMFTMARIWQRLRNRMTDAVCEAWWTVMRWTKSMRHALGLRKTVISRVICRFTAN